jgi:peroxidase
MPENLLQRMQKACPKRNSATAIVLDQTSVHKFDTAYFQNVRAGRGLMTSDQTLYDADADLRQYVNANLNQKTFSQRFGQAMFAMSTNTYLTAPDGEIRKRCQYRN